MKTVDKYMLKTKIRDGVSEIGEQRYDTFASMVCMCVSGQGIVVESPKCVSLCMAGLGTESPVAFPAFLRDWPCPTIQN